MVEELVEYEAAGLAMQGRIFRPKGVAKQAAVLVFPEAFGLGEHALTRAAALADLGYTALACDLHGEARRFTEMQEVLARILPLRAAPEQLLEIADVPYGLLQKISGQPAGRIAAFGYCIGGTLGLELLRNGRPLGLVAGFHAGLAPVSGHLPPKGLTARVFMAVGSDDSLIPQQERIAFEAEMAQTDLRWQLSLYGGVVHSFTDPEADLREEPEKFCYDGAADRASWHSALALLEQCAN